MQTDQKRCSVSGVMLSASVFLAGGFHEYISCGLAVVLSVYLLLRLGKTRMLRLRKSLWALAVGVLCAGYGLTCLWAIDRGMALIGFLKFLPVGLYLLCVWQEDNGKAVLRWLPYVGTVAAAVSAVGMQFPIGEHFFSVAGRFAGFFQYPNSFAVFLLVCELLLLKKEEKKLWDYGVLVVLLLSILYTGSRIAFVIAVLANVAMLFMAVSKRLRLVLLAVLGIGLGAVLLLATNENSVFHRYLSISLGESTLVGRILYYLDALKLLLKYPFGMGYMGYFYTQGEVQSGVYSVMYIHNDFYQFLLDTGWIPGGLVIGAVVHWFFKKHVAPTDKLIAGAVCLHSLLDFDLQFISLFMLLALLLDDEKAQWIQVKKPGGVRIAAGAAAVLCLYMGAALGLAHMGQRELSDTLYPYNTQNKLAMLEQAEDLQSAQTLANEILATNRQYYASYSVKAKCCYSEGDFEGVIRCKNEVFRLQPFAYTEYEEYCQMLINGIAMYEKVGEFRSAEVCKAELKAVSARLKNNAQLLSPLGKKIKDQPVFLLSERVQAYIDGLE